MSLAIYTKQRVPSERLQKCYNSGNFTPHYFVDEYETSNGYGPIVTI